MTPTEIATPRAASTVLLVRDGAGGLEVFMVARDRQVDFASGAVVFPGGKVDADDSGGQWARQVAVRSSPPLPNWIAAVRETFEEAGVLIARRQGDAALPDGDQAAAIAARCRGPLLDGKMTFSAIAAAEQIVPALDLMVPFAHWITPVEAPRRFDTHFFLAAAPAGHAATHDGREAVRSQWSRPCDLLADGKAGRQTLVPATQLNLELLAETDRVADAMAAARARRVVTVTPRLVKLAGGMGITIPADAGYRTTELVVRRG